MSCPNPAHFLKLLIESDPKVDDGSDQDYDSHIMVWQLPVAESGGGRHAMAPPALSATTPTSVRTNGSSRTSSSLDLAGPTPGSGVVTADSDDDPAGAGGEPIELGVDAAAAAEDENGACDSYANWNRDVQSMLDRVGKNGTKSPTPPGDSSTISDATTVDTLSSSAFQREEDAAPSPKEDFSQHPNLGGDGSSSTSRKGRGGRS